MIRRLVFAAAALLGVGALTSCATFTGNDVAASVNGDELAQDDLSAMLDSDLGALLLQFDPEQERIAGDTARALISVWVRLQLWSETIEVPADVTQRSQEQAVEQFGDDWTAAPEALRQLVITDGEIGQLLQDGRVDEATLQAALDTAEITVDPRYGGWDRAQARVVGLG